MTSHPRSFGYARTRTRQNTLAAATLTATMLLAACGSGGGTPSKTSVESAPTSVSASPTPSTTDLAKAKVVSTYTGFWNTAVQAWTQGSLDNVQVDKYAVDDGDYLIKSALEYYISQNLVMRGRPVLHPVVSVINLTKKPYTATVSDCIDDTNFYPVNKTTGTPATLAKTGHRHPASYQERFDGQWWVVNGSIDRTKTC